MEVEKAWLICYHESMEQTAVKLKSLLSWEAELAVVEWRRFDDCFPNIRISEEDSRRLERFSATCLLLSLHCPEVIFEQLCFLYTMASMRARSLRVIIPWFSTATMERVDTPGQIATAMSLARMLSSCPVGPAGPVTVVTYDIHWRQEEFYFKDPTLVELKTAVKLFRDILLRLEEEGAGEEVGVAFDAADQHFRTKFAGFPHIICSKVRDGDRRIVKVLEGSAAGKHCVIVDDLVQSGSTLLEFAKVLQAQGAAKISCMSTHAVFPKQSYTRFIGNSMIHKFWITDSVPSTANVLDGQPPFEVLTLAPLIAEDLHSFLGCT